MSNKDEEIEIIQLRNFRFIPQYLKTSINKKIRF